MMKLLFPSSLFLASCTSVSAVSDAHPTSVRDRLAGGPTRLLIGGNDSTGTLTARRWTLAGWIAGDTALAIDRGELSASVDGNGELVLNGVAVSIAPIDLPEDVFGTSAQLTDLRVVSTGPAKAAAAWTSDDAANARLSLELAFEWAIAIGSVEASLGPQQLPPIDAELGVGGDGTTIGASLSLEACGELWSWLGLLELTHLELSLSAATVD